MRKERRRTRGIGNRRRKAKNKTTMTEKRTRREKNSRGSKRRRLRKLKRNLTAAPTSQHHTARRSRVNESADDATWPWATPARHLSPTRGVVSEGEQTQRKARDEHNALHRHQLYSLRKIMKKKKKWIIIVMVIQIRIWTRMKIIIIITRRRQRQNEKKSKPARVSASRSSSSRRTAKARRPYLERRERKQGNAKHTLTPGQILADEPSMWRHSRFS